MLDRLTVAPPGGAGAIRYTVQEVLLPPVRLAEPHATDDTPGVDTGLVRPSENVREFPLKVATINADKLSVTDVGAFTVNPTLLLPAFTVTLEGTVAYGLLLERATTVLLGAAAVRFTLHDAVAGGATLAGVHVTLERTAPDVPPPPVMPITVPEPVMVMLLALASVPDTLLALTDAVVLVVEGEI